MAACLVARGLCRSFSGPGGAQAWAVDGLDIDVAAGEVVGLLGENGAGKTTTLRMLATLLPPNAGTIRIAGVDARARPVHARRALAYVPAEAGLPARLSACEVVTLFARLHGLTEPAARAKGALRLLGAEGFGDAPCSTLSTGMKRRVVLARALVHEPRLLLLDEPTDGLDVAGRRAVLNIIADLAAGGCGVVLSSHIMSEVESVASRFVVLSDGRCVGKGTAKELLQATGQARLDEAFLVLTEGT